MEREVVGEKGPPRPGGIDVEGGVSEIAMRRLRASAKHEAVAILAEATIHQLLCHSA